MKHITHAELLAEFDPSVHGKIAAALARPGVGGMVIYENQDFCSSCFGNKTALVVGPGCTYKTIEDAAAGHLNDLPSQRQYPVAAYLKEEHDHE